MMMMLMMMMMMMMMIVNDRKPKVVGGLRFSIFHRACESKWQPDDGELTTNTLQFSNPEMENKWRHRSSETRQLVTWTWWNFILATWIQVLTLTNHLWGAHFPYIRMYGIYIYMLTFGVYWWWMLPYMSHTCGSVMGLDHFAAFPHSESSTKSICPAAWQPSTKDLPQSYHWNRHLCDLRDIPESTWLWKNDFFIDDHRWFPPHWSYGAGWEMPQQHCHFNDGRKSINWWMFNQLMLDYQRIPTVSASLTVLAL